MMNHPPNLRFAGSRKSFPSLRLGLGSLFALDANSNSIFYFLVPLVMSNTDHKLKCPPDYNAALCDVATTILDVMGVNPPPEMTGRSLLAN